MTLNELREKIDSKRARLAVIGLGYVGLPVALKFVEIGFDVLGVERVEERVQLINSGISPIDGIEPGLPELLAQVITTGRFQATSDYALLADRDVILIDVETPVDDRHIPHYEALKSALEGLIPYMKQGVLIVVESTISPGTMENVVLPLILERSGLILNRDFYLGNCPERVMPGKLLANLQNVSRVVGGMTPETAETLSNLYRYVVQADLDPTDCVTAELVKTVENAYRDVQIAFANEVALVCEAIGGNVWNVRDLVNKSPYRQMHLPGAGVGGHCIPKDPWLLAYGAREVLPLRLIPAARAINDDMPAHVLELIMKALETVNCQPQDARILVFGYAYLEDSDDTRNSPSEVLIRHLNGLGADVIVHDPYVPQYQGNWRRQLRNCDLAVFMVKHAEYKNLDLETLAQYLDYPLVVDARNIFDIEKARQAGLKYWSIGIAHH
jgi:UDP-N-acetyl-D-mannosaminuronic acid dehydrogenase